MEEESGYHGAVRCTKIVALRHEMHEHWALPGEKHFQYTRPDWLLHILSLVETGTRAKVLLLLWRAWHIQNDIMHDKGTSTVTGSTQFLKHYAVSLGLAEQVRQVHANDKGKEKIEEGSGLRDWNLEGGVLKTCIRKGWAPPPVDWTKLNTDAGFFVTIRGRQAPGW
jgi:hypothetical protein